MILTVQDSASLGYKRGRVSDLLLEAKLIEEVVDSLGAEGIVNEGEDGDRVADPLEKCYGGIPEDDACEDEEDVFEYA